MQLCRDNIDDFVFIYLDDILIYNTTTDEHEVHLRKVFARLRENKLQAKLKKCEFSRPHVKYLGHVVGSGKLHVDMDKVAAVRDWSAPVDIEGV